MLKFNDFQTLITSAEAYYYLGYAVIPLLGDFDPSRPKVAARPWSAYQQRLAALSEINEWFTPEGGAAALGIVTGHVSHLAILDFDSSDLYEAFRRQCPDLVETRTVQSAGRALPHLYFHLPSHLRLASQKRQGVDLLSDGRYVVAPPTTINGQAYRVTRGGTPHTLTPYDLQRIQSFLHAVSSIKEEPLSPSPTNTPSSVGEGLRPSRIDMPPFPKPTPNETNTAPAPLPVFWGGVGGGVTDGNVPTNHVVSAPRSPRPEGEGPGVRALPSRADLHRLYTYWRTQGGRNDALFKTALYARDHGLTEHQTRRALAALHISAPCAPSPLMERGLGGEVSPAHRQREAYATIHSAFSRPPRIPSSVGTQHAVSASSPSLVYGGGLGRGLPNTLRETLLQRKMTFVVRTLEGLLQSGIRPGQGFTTDQALKALKGIVGRDSIYNALNTLAPDGQPIFPQHPPSALPQASKEAARDNGTLKTKKCFFVTKKNSGIKKRGIKQRRFKFPKIEALCKRFGVDQSASDPLTRDDLASAHRTRMALHRELIKRRPAEYSRRWLANRIGVTRRTLDTYNRLIPIHVQATYHETPLSWNNLNDLLSDEILSGAHLETLMGKKYPALKAVAAKLIARGTYIRLMQRKSSFYWYGFDQPPISQTTSSPVGKGLRPFHVSSTTPVATQHVVSTSAPLSMQWRGAGGEDAAQPALSASSSPSPFMERGLGGEVSPTPSTSSVGKGLRPFHVSSPFTVGTQHAVSASSSPSPFMERGLGGEVKSFRAPLPDAVQESLAQTLYTRVNACGNPTTRHLSLGNARKLVFTYPAPQIQAALKRLQQRTNLDNPTGFFVTVLRSSAHQNE